MLLERTILQLDIGPVSTDRARELGQMGYIQWLGALPGGADYRREAMRAYAMATPFRHGSPAIAAFCDLLVASSTVPPQPIALSLPRPQRRGGAQARRLTL